MTRTSIIPDTNGFYLPIPQQYVGKEVEVLIFPKSEVTEMAKPAKKSMAQYRGILSKKEGENIQRYIVEKAIAEVSNFQQFLLSAPVMSAEQYADFCEQRQHLNSWRTV